MPEYLNYHNYDIYLVGPDGAKIRIKGGRVITLPQFFDRYVRNGYIKHYTPLASPPPSQPGFKIVAKLPIASRAAIVQKARSQIHKTPQQTLSPIIRNNNNKIVGKIQRAGATESLHKSLGTNFFPISDHIGVGILSFNRLNSLCRLVNSIINFSDLKRLTVFISDDCSTSKELLSYLQKLDKTNNFTIIYNRENIGVAGNANRLIRCLSRFPHKILLNDDVEILRDGWSQFYFDTMAKTGFHHFCHYQPGVYGAPDGVKVSFNKVDLIRVGERPHGAIMAFDQKAFNTVGYFDEIFGPYGVEHVDWSARVSASSIQPPGFFDVSGSLDYFKIYCEKSVVPERIGNLHAAKAIYKSLPTNRIKITASKRSVVPRISCVIPFKDLVRHNVIQTIVDNIRAQRFPDIEIILSEQDIKSRFTESDLECTTHVLLSTANQPFNKSIAFNAGVALATSDKLLLHDADILVPAHYMKTIYSALESVESTHMGNRVLYADKRSSDLVAKTKVVNDDIQCDKIVTYFEGGSIGCRYDTYWRVGGFVEAFVGYGVEDCDFYYRLSKASKWYDNRIFDFLHLWHNRTPGWNELHANNKAIGIKLLALGLEERINRQHRYFSKTKYAKFIQKLK